MKKKSRNGISVLKFAAVFITSTVFSWGLGVAVTYIVATRWGGEGLV